MEKGLINRLQATLLATATLGLVLLAALNFLQERRTEQPPDDGVWWREAADGSGLVADKVLPNSPGARAGIRERDLLTGVSVVPVGPVGSGIRAGIPQQDLLGAVKPIPADSSPNANSSSGTEPGTLPSEAKYTPVYTRVVRSADLVRALYRTGSYFQINYRIWRDGNLLSSPVEVIPEPLDRSLALGQRLIGLIYLAIGIYVLFRRWTAPRATHFYLFCLVSFALYALKYTGAGDESLHWDKLDQFVFWFNVLAESLQPALFLHFALSFPEERFKRLGRLWLLPLVYLPGTLLLGVWFYAIKYLQPTALLKHHLDQISTAYDAIF